MTDATTTAAADAATTPTVACRTSHIGLCVSDLERSLSFYRDGLGFRETQRFEISEDIAEVDPPCDLTSLFIAKDGLTLELLAYRSPGVVGEPHTRRNHLGMTHLSFVVDDVEDAAARMERHGGTVLPHTRSGADDPAGIQILFVADPDGNRVEFMRLV